MGLTCFSGGTGLLRSSDCKDPRIAIQSCLRRNVASPDLAQLFLNFRELLAISDVLLLPSELESFGLVALEAMACEVPVIATRVGGVPEVVRDGIDGYLYEVGDVQAMADGCLSVLNNPRVRDNLGKAARGRAMRHFCASKIVLQYEDLYSQTIEDVRSRR